MTVPVRKKLGLENYNLMVTLISFVALIAYFIVIYNRAKTNGILKQILSYLGINIILAILCFKILFVLNIEAVHFVQYAIFAILCFPFTQNYFATAGISMWAGAIDEAYQYFYLSPLRTEYYDFNDVIINTVGAGFGLILIRAFAQYKSEIKKWNPFFLLTAVILLVFLCLYISGIISVLPNEDVPYSLIRVVQAEFWTTVHPNIKFYVVKPLEGCLIILALLFFYRKLNFKNPKHSL